MISSLYDFIHSLCPVSWYNIKTQLEVDLGEEISEELWDAILRRVHSSSICARHGLTQCKILHRTHFAKVRLSRVFNDVDYHTSVIDVAKPLLPTSICFGHALPYTPIGWKCLTRFQFVCTAQHYLGFRLPLCCFQKGVFVASVTLLARRLILLRRKSPAPPSTHPPHSSRIKDIFNFVNIEKICCTIQ